MTCISFVNFTTRLSVIKMGNTDSRYNQVNYINHYYSCIVKDKCSTCDALWEEYIENCDREPERRTRNENHRTHQRNYINHYCTLKEKLSHQQLTMYFNIVVMLRGNAVNNEIIVLSNDVYHC